MARIFLPLCVFIFKKKTDFALFDFCGVFIFSKFCSVWNSQCECWHIFYDKIIQIISSRMSWFLNLLQANTKIKTNIFITLVLLWWQIFKTNDLNKHIHQIISHSIFFIYFFLCSVMHLLFTVNIMLLQCVFVSNEWDKLKRHLPHRSEWTCLLNTVAREKKKKSEQHQ